MKVFLKKSQAWLFPGAILIMIAGFVLSWFGLNRPIKIILDGEERIIRTSSLSVPGILKTAGIEPEAEDFVMAASDESIWRVHTILVNSARLYVIKTPDEEVKTESTKDIPANVLKTAGIDLYPHDQVLINGTVVDPYRPIQESGSVLIQYKPAASFTLIDDNQEQVIYTNEATLGAALEDALVQVSPKDWISNALSIPVDQLEVVTVRRAKPVSVKINGGVVTGLTPALTVGEALVDIGQPLQNLDYSQPPADAPLPDDGQIEIVRVEESLMLTTDETPFENEWVEDPEALLDTTSVVETGQMGIYATRERLRYENGEEVWRSPAEYWQASQAKDGVLGYGSKVEIRTEVVDGQQIEYWRKITVYATAYSPCRSGVDRCLYGTATGIMPVQKGVVAVTPRWLSVPNGYGMWGQSVYIPGYGHGVIADVGGGIPGTPWIDLAYSDDNFQSWNRWTTMYFLTPVPAWYPAILAP